MRRLFRPGLGFRRGLPARFFVGPYSGLSFRFAPFEFLLRAKPGILADFLLHGFVGLAAGFFFGLTSGFFFRLAAGFFFGLAAGFLFGLTAGFFFGLAAGFFFGLTPGFLFGLLSGLRLLAPGCRLGFLPREFLRLLPDFLLDPPLLLVLVAQVGLLIDRPGRRNRRYRFGLTACLLLGVQSGFLLSLALCLRLGPLPGFLFRLQTGLFFGLAAGFRLDFLPGLSFCFPLGFLFRLRLRLPRSVLTFVFPGFSRFPFPLNFAAVGPGENTPPVRQIVFPLSLVTAPVRPGHGAETPQMSLQNLAFITAAVGPGDFALRPVDVRDPGQSEAVFLCRVDNQHKKPEASMSGIYDPLKRNPVLAAVNRKKTPVHPEISRNIKRLTSFSGRGPTGKNNPLLYQIV
ncbi:MAG: hypothetical protein PHV00_02310 [Syntrophales bacterium]|nr:hypothetical protein [Syntrophales bacterium]